MRTLTQLTSLLLLLLFPPPGQSDLAARELLAHWVEATHLTETGAIETFLEANLAPSFLESAPLAIHVRIQRALGPLELHSILEAEPASVSALVRNGRAEWLRVTLALAGTSELRIAGVQLSEARAPEQLGLVVKDGFRFPETAAGRTLRDWYTAFQQPDPAAVQAFLRARFEPAYLARRGEETLFEVHQTMAFMGGLLAPARVLEGGPRHLKVLADDGHAGLELELFVDESEPPRIVGFGVVARGMQPELHLERATSDAQFVRRLGQELDALAAAEGFAGAVLVARGDEPLFRRAFGMADREQRRANTPATRFHLGSMTKMLTAVAIARLIERDELSFETRAGEVLTELEPSPLARLSVEALLTHSSGWGVGAMESLASSGLAPTLATNHDWLARVLDWPVQAQPGQEFAYSNAGYLLLGAIVERIQGEAFEIAIEELVHAPAGMAASAFLTRASEARDRAVGYAPDLGASADGWRANTDELFGRGNAAGGSYSTVDDLLAFARALLGGALLEVETLDRLTLARSFGAAPATYAAGFEVADSGDGQGWFGHTGGFTGVSTAMRILPERGLTWIVLANQGAAGPVMERIRQLFPSEPR